MQGSILNSACYHAPPYYPGHTPGELHVRLFPTPMHTERDSSPCPGLLVDYKYTILCK